MRSSDIRFPETLRSALRDGELVVFAGAGLSMGNPACLPDFTTLADSIAKGSGETRIKDETDDAFLGRLHKSGVQVHNRAARLLQTNRCGDPPSPTGLHRDLVRLYPEPDKVRIVTTNFDLLFDAAARDLFAEQPDLFRAPALPLGREFNGIVHVHGCLDRPQGMVLTDADFGRAYLTDGWASRFLVELFHSTTVMFVGYKVRGNSMEPEMRDGDRLVVDTARRTPATGELFVLWDGTGLVVKRVEPVHEAGPPRLRLLSANSDYPAYTSLADEVHIVGKVLWKVTRA